MQVLAQRITDRAPVVARFSDEEMALMDEHDDLLDLGLGQVEAFEKLVEAHRNTANATLLENEAFRMWLCH